MSDTGKGLYYLLSLNDLPEMVKLHYSILLETDPLMRRLHPRGITPALIDHGVGQWLESKQNASYDLGIWRAFTNQLGVHAEGQENIVAFACFTILNNGPGGNEVQASSPGSEIYPTGIVGEEIKDAAAIDLAHEVTRRLEEFKKSNIPGMHILIDPLVVASSHNSKAVVVQLITYAQEFARKRQLLCYVVSFPWIRSVFMDQKFTFMKSYTEDLGPTVGTSGGERLYRERALLRWP